MTASAAALKPKPKNTITSWAQTAREVATGTVRSGLATVGAAIGALVTIGGSEFMLNATDKPSANTDLIPNTVAILSAPVMENIAYGLGAVIVTTLAAEFAREKIKTFDRAPKNKMSRRIGWGVTALALVGTTAALEYYDNVQMNNMINAQRPTATLTATPAAYNK